MTPTPRRDRLREALAAYGSLVVAYSGGVDSSFLLAEAVDVLGDNALAATAVSPSLPESERRAAADLARSLGARQIEVRTDEMERAAYRRNAGDRCFHCKSALFDGVEPLAKALGIRTIAVGTVLDDLGDHRPGQRAARQRGVVTPLVDAGLGKGDVRALAHARGLPTWDKPAAACLASRVVYGLEVTPIRLDRIERAEEWLRRRVPTGGNLRVRDHGDVARVEVDREALSAVVAISEEVSAHLRDLGWTYVTLDLEGFRSGSLNAQLVVDGGSRAG